jgi:thioesterase domain-containing protein
LKRLGIHDNFFESGGHSLLAVRIFSEIEKEFGDRPPLATLFQAPTIEKLAAALDDRSWKAALSPLVAIQPQGKNPPFFAIHGAEGNVLFYRKFSELLGKEQPFYALQAQGLDGAPLTRTSVEDIADYYLEEIRKVQPHGPYLLGGFSFGGPVSYEIARRLHAAGEKIALLALFEPANPGKPARVRSWIEVARSKIPRLLSHGTTAHDVFQFLARHIGGGMSDKLLRLNERLLSLAKSGQNNPAKLVERQLQIVHTRAQLAYRPLPYPGKITLFRAADQPGYYEVEPDSGWSAFAQGGVEIHDVPGSHTTIFWDDNTLPHFARKVAECIRSCLGTDELNPSSSA